MSTPRKLSPEELAHVLRYVDGWCHERVSQSVRAHIAALEAELARLTPSGQRLLLPVTPAMHAALDAALPTAPSGQVAEDARRARVAIESARSGPPVAQTVLADALDGLSRLAAKAQGYEAMRAERDALQERLGTAACAYCAWRDRHDGTLADMKAKLLAHVAVCTKHPMRGLEAERDAAVADNAALLAMLRKWLEADGDAETPDLTELTAQLAAFICYLVAHDVAGRPHPGAALLAEHAKALVRARNEGLKRAAELLKNSRALRGYADAASQILALQEPEPCSERDTNGDGDCDRHPRRKP